jgi:hypothetical protein
MELDKKSKAFLIGMAVLDACILLYALSYQYP